jgi:Holliday junction resolvasome RuvABC endonuclease subunit
MFLGLDLSLSSSGAIIIDDNYKILQRQILSTSSVGVERLYFLEEILKSFLQDNVDKLSLICIESPAYGISEGNLFNLGQWAGIVELTLFKLGKKYIFASPSQLKKYVMGFGKGAKQLMLLKTFQNFCEEFEDDNLCDAYGLARIAHDYYLFKKKNTEFPLKKYQEEVLNKIYKTEKINKAGRVL